jgi:hypothetical protein
MVIITIIAIVFGIVATAFAVTFYRELWKWARECEHARVAIAYNRRVAMQPTLRDLLLWSRQVDKNERGQVIFGRNKVSVAVVRPVIPPGRVRKLFMRPGKSVPTQRSQAVEGTWKAQDQTPPERKNVTVVTGNKEGTL